MVKEPKTSCVLLPITVTLYWGFRTSILKLDNTLVSHKTRGLSHVHNLNPCQFYRCSVLRS